MSEDNNTIPDGPEDTFDSTEVEPQLSANEWPTEGTVAIAGLVFPKPNEVMLVEPSMQLAFRIPGVSGSHRTYIKYQLGGAMTTLLNGEFYSSNHWHYLSVPGLVEKDTISYFFGMWHYVDTNSPETYQGFIVRSPAAFDAPDVVADTVSGTARKGSVIKLLRPSSATVLSESVTVGTNGQWTVKLLSSVSQGPQETAIWEDFAGTTGRYAAYKTLTVLKVPSITAPISNLPVIEMKPMFVGQGVAGATVNVYLKGTTTIVASKVVGSNNQWSVQSTHTFTQSGPCLLEASQSYGGVTTARSEHSFPLIGPPAITAPAAGSTQSAIFTLSGNNGLSGAAIEVYIDLTTTKVGTGTVAANGTWTAAVTLPSPGPVTLAVLQKLSTKTSVRGAPRAFKGGLSVPTLLSRPKNEGVELYGTGYTGALMEVNRVGGPVFLDATVAAGVWSKEIPPATLPGNHSLKGRQSIPDGGSGRIFSGWSADLVVNLPTPKPTGMNVTVNGQKGTFSGKGRQWGTARVAIEIRHNAALLPGVLHVDVQANLNWTVTANANHAPGTYVLTARQWVNNQWSADSATFSMIVASPVPVFTKPADGSITGQLPQISGFAWANSAIALKISDKPDVQLTATEGVFILNAAENWAPRTYTLQATAVFGGQTSSVGSRTFTVKPPKPIVSTLPGAEVGLVAIIEGQGWEGCWVFIYSATHLELAVTQVGADKKWTAELAERQPGDLTFYAKQKETGSSLNVSDNTANITVKVRLAPPVILVPAENGRPARESVFSGSADPLSAVELYHEGETLPFLKDIRVNEDGKWEANVTLPAGGPITVIAKVRKGLVLSAPFPRIVTVVPAPPVIDTPSGGELVGRRLRISGFGYPGDKVRIDRRGNYSNIGNVDVTENGTWYADIAHGSTETVGISVLAQLGSLDSLYSPTITMAVLVGPPEIADPQAEDWVGLRPLYSGRAAPGASITVASSFNADDVLAPSTEADALGLWAVTGNKDLPVGEARVQVCQTLEGRRSEWVLSGRFMVERMAAKFEAPTVDFPLVGQDVGRYPMFAGTGVAGAVVTIIRADHPDTLLGTALVDRYGKWALRSQIELPVAASLYTYSVRQSRDGAISGWLLPNRTIKVIQVPAGFTKPTIELPVDDPAQVLEQRPLFAGTGIPGAEVKVYKAQASAIYATARVDAQGNWSARCAVELPVGETPHAITVRQTMDGQDSAWMGGMKHFKVAEKIAPPVFVSPSEGAHVPINAVIRGTAMPGAEIRLYQSGNPNTIVGAGITDEQGHWVLVTGPLPVGAYQVTGKGFKGELVSGWMAARKFTVFEAG